MVNEVSGAWCEIDWDQRMIEGKRKNCAGGHALTTEMSTEINISQWKNYRKYGTNGLEEREH